MYLLAINEFIVTKYILNTLCQYLIIVHEKKSIPNLDEMKSMEKEVIKLVNIERANNGLAPLKEN